MRQGKVRWKAEVRRDVTKEGRVEKRKEGMPLNFVGSR